jgi:N-acetylmuramoyl-L-alanine amidase
MASALLLAILAGCSTTPPEHPPDVVMLSDQDMVVAEPEPISPPVLQPALPPAKVPAPPVAPANHFNFNPGETWISLDRWSQSNGFGLPRRLSANPEPAYSFTSSHGTMAVRVGSQLAWWNGSEYYLGFAPLLIDGHPFVHSLDMRKNFVPLLDNPVHLKTNRVIVIDPGHGGADVGTTNVINGHFEKEYTLDLARRLQPLLAGNGWTVWLTRTNDVKLALSNRVAFAEQHKAGLFLSLHFNTAFPDRRQAGLETYCLTPAGMPSNLTRGYTDFPSLVFPNNNFDEENLQYAFRLHRALLNVNGHADRGVRRARFLGVLQGQNRPAVLVEGGYLSNPGEAREIADPAYRQKLAEAIARALAEDSGTDTSLAVRSAVPPPGTNQDGKVN